jgi:hypothetical protein
VSKSILTTVKKFLVAKMRPIEKINLIKNLLEELNKFTNFEQEIFLDYCQIKCQTNSWNDDLWIELEPTLYNTKDSSKLIKLAQELEISPNLVMISKHYPHNWENDSNLKAFISYSSKFKDSAHRLKDALNFHKISGFVAHDDVVPSTEWQDQIEKGLNTMDFFI